jgi:hypothetical protein
VNHHSGSNNNSTDNDSTTISDSGKDKLLSSNPRRKSLYNKSSINLGLHQALTNQQHRRRRKERNSRSLHSISHKLDH